MKLNARTARPAFTLIELLAVITIIVILASLVVSGMSYVTDRQAREKAKVQIALLSKALEDYKSDIGQYPVTADSTTGLTNSANSLYIPLFYEGYDYKSMGTPPATWTKTVGTVDVAKSTKIYLADLDPTTSKQGWVDTVTPVPTTSLVKDPWGNEYRYRTGLNSSGTANTNTQNPDFDLWSSGKDGKTNPGTPSDALNRDDITNF